MYPDSTFSKLDFLAPEVKLNIEGNKRMRTKVGGLLTVCFLTSLVFAAVFIFRTYLRTDTPTSINEMFNRPEYPKIDLFEHRIMPVVIGYVGDTFSILAEDMKYYVSLVAARQTWYSAVDENGEAITKLNETYFEVVPCVSLGEDNLQLYDYFGKDTYLYEMISLYGMCIKPEEGLYVQGKGSDDLFESVSLRIKPCSLDSGCKPVEEIEQLNFYVTQPQTSLDQANLENPYQKTVNADSLYYISTRVAQLYNTRIKFNRVLDFRGLLPAWVERTSFYDIKDTFYNTASRDPSQFTCAADEVLDSSKCVSYLEMMFQSSGSVANINRRYKTLTETFGELGGIKEVLFIIFFWAYYHYNLKVRNQYLIDHVYGLSDDLDKKSNKEIRNHKNGKNNAKWSAFDLELSDLRTQGFLNYFRCCCCKKTKKREEIRQFEIRKSAIDGIKSSLNVINIIKEMNHLKVVCMYLFRSRHFKLSPLIQFNLSRRLNHEQTLIGKGKAGSDGRGKGTRVGPMFNISGCKLLDSTEASLKENEEAMEEIEAGWRNASSPPTDMIEHQLDRFFYRCMKETDEYIHDHIENVEGFRKHDPTLFSDTNSLIGHKKTQKVKFGNVFVDILNKEGQSEKYGKEIGSRMNTLSQGGEQGLTSAPSRGVHFGNYPQQGLKTIKRSSIAIMKRGKKVVKGGVVVKEKREIGDNFFSISEMGKSSANYNVNNAIKGINQENIK